MARLVRSSRFLEPSVGRVGSADEFGARRSSRFGVMRRRPGWRADLSCRASGGPEYRTLVAQTLGASALEQLERDLDTFFQVEDGGERLAVCPPVAARVQPPVLLLVGADSRRPTTRAPAAARMAAASRRLVVPAPTICCHSSSRTRLAKPSPASSRGSRSRCEVSALFVLGAELRQPGR